MRFKIKSDFKPAGDQPEAIKRLTGSLQKDNRHQVLLGVTGSGKTFTMAHVIAKTARPALILSHNKTLAAQLYEEFKEFPFRSGLNKGDIIFVWGRSEYNLGDIIIFDAGGEYAKPIIHRLISTNPYSTKGDHNPSQASFETNIPDENLLGKSLFKIPLAGWVKLIFFEPFQPPQNRGLCN